MHIGDGKDLYFLVLTVILSYRWHKNGRLMPCSVSCHWWACYLDLLMDCAFLERQPAHYAFKLKLKQSFGKRRPGNSCVMMLEKKLLNPSTTATLKTAPSTGTREKSRLIKCVSISILVLFLLSTRYFWIWNLDATEIHCSILFYFHEPQHHFQI